MKKTPATLPKGYDAYVLLHDMDSDLASKLESMVDNNDQSNNLSLLKASLIIEAVNYFISVK